MTDAHTNVVEDESLTPVEEHLAGILATIRPLVPTQLGVNDAYGLVLAEEIVPWLRKYLDSLP